ncbi:hypothetical protein GMA12_06965 [Kocuria sediminis]|uniref:DUF4381 family protein n=1 Tax=Kocuria sediminis TaxID=1038857 RepID=A0A6N8GNN6_9MICC|nr:hypothetical protein [Kocuria sediminis]MUN62883.1 hypothetical protein [Kocuria sediminis]
MNVQMEALVIQWPWWLDYVNALAWVGSSLALVVAAYFLWRTHTLRRRSDMRSGQWESLARAIDQALDAQECHQLQIRMLMLVQLARQHEFWFGDVQLLGDVNDVLARRIVAGELCSDSASSSEIVVGPPAVDGEAVARPLAGAQEELWKQEEQSSLGVIRVEVLQQEVPYRSQQERELLKLSNELQHILRRSQH